MKNVKKFLALGLAAAMTLSLAACGGNGGSSSGGENQGGASTPSNGGSSDVVNNDISVGTWWTDMTYNTGDDISASVDWQNAQLNGTETPEEEEMKLFNQNVAQMKFDNLHAIEEKYGISWHYDNLTYAGVQESINTSILAGTPDCDIYLVEPAFGVPAQLNGLAIDLRTILPEDHDIFTDQKIMSYLDLGDGKVCIIKRTEAQSSVEATYPLGFNMQMLADNNLEDPRDLWERGEWTWDKFIEYCQVLTQDTDGDGQIDQYGYCGYQNETFEQLLMSNGANVASGATEGLTDPKTTEVLQMISDMYNTYNVCYPYDEDSNSNSDSMRNQYTQGNIGFFPIAAWIASGNGDYNYDGKSENPLTWDTAYVRWPVGPSGNKDTNAGKNATGGEFYIIPQGVAEPEKVVNILYDYWNWFHDDTSIRDDKKTLNWWYGVTAYAVDENDPNDEDLRTANFDVMNDCGSHSTFDLWGNLGVDYDLVSLINGTMTPAQFQETYKNEVQAALDALYK